MGLWDSINEKRKDLRDPAVRAFHELDSSDPHTATKAMERAGRELGASVRKGNAEAVLMSAYLLVRDGEPGAARLLLRQHEELCQAHGDLAYLRGEAELRVGYTPVAGVRARRWARLARRLGVSSTVNLAPLRQSTQAMILLAFGVALALAAAAARPLARSWRLVGVVAGAGISLPALLRQLAFHRVWAVVLSLFFVTVAVAALSSTA